MKMMKALLFGSFNPVTNAHISMGICARNVLGHDFDITYIPASNRYIKDWKGYGNGNILPENIRIMLLKNAVAAYGFSVSDVETSHITDGKTYNTMKYFGFDNCVLCLGMDNIIQIKKWFRWKDLLHKSRLLIFRRGTYDKDYKTEMEEILTNVVHGYTFADLSEKWTNISSTKVRNCYVNKDMETLKTLVPENVFKYLEANLSN